MITTPIRDYNFYFSIVELMEKLISYTLFVKNSPYLVIISIIFCKKCKKKSRMLEEENLLTTTSGINSSLSVVDGKQNNTSSFKKWAQCIKNPPKVQIYGAFFHMELCKPSMQNEFVNFFLKL